MVSFLDNWPEGPEDFDAATPPPGQDDGKKGRHGGARAVFTPDTGEQRAPSSEEPARPLLSERAIVWSAIAATAAVTLTALVFAMLWFAAALLGPA